MSDNSSDLGAFLAGFVIGGLVGAATAIILAPQSGAETRAQISAKSQELAQSGNEQYHHYVDTANTYTTEYKDRAGAAITHASERVQDQARIVLDRGTAANTEQTEVVDTVKVDVIEESDNSEGDAA